MNRINSFTLVFALLFTFPCFAQEQQNTGNRLNKETSDKKICITSTIEDTSKIIANPGNCPIEILRRLGRSIAKVWTDHKKYLKSGTVLLNQYAGTPNFIRTIPEKFLTDEQKKACDDLINNNSEVLSKLSSEYNAASEAITIKVAFDISEIKNSLKSLIDSNGKLPAVSTQEVDKIKDNFMPIINIFSNTCGVLSISEKGIFGRANIESKEGRFSEFVPIRNLTINQYLDEEPLIVLAQTHGTEEASMVMKKLEAVPNMSVIKQMVASSGLDFEKDIISNYTTESILYINLTPTGEKLIPDVRWVALVPTIDKLVEVLPKFNNFCMQAGIFINNVESTFPDIKMVMLSHFMTGGYGVYASIYDKFCILTSTKEGNIKAIEHLKNIPKETKEDIIKDSNLFFRVKTADLNIQLQQFLQSPMLRNQRIPPITNLTFLNDMDNINVYTKVSDKNIKMILDIPFFKKNKK